MYSSNVTWNSVCFELILKNVTDDVLFIQSQFVSYVDVVAEVIQDERKYVIHKHESGCVAMYCFSISFFFFLSFRGRWTGRPQLIFSKVKIHYAFYYFKNQGQFNRSRIYTHIDDVSLYIKPSHLSNLCLLLKPVHVLMGIGHVIFRCCCCLCYCRFC